MGEEYEVHGQHDHAVEHAADADALGRWLLLISGCSALAGIGFWIAAWA